MSQNTHSQDDALQIADAAVRLMTDFHGKAQPDDTRDMNAVFPAAAFKVFVDGHANLMYRLAQLRKSAVVPAAPVKTWRERIGAGPDFPLHAPTAVEQAMVAQIADLVAVIARLGGSTAASLDMRAGFEKWMSDRGEAVGYEGDGVYAYRGVNEQSDAFRAGAEFAVASAKASGGDATSAAGAGAWVEVIQQRLYDLRNDINTTCQLLHENEWADHFATTPEGRVLETAITALVSRANREAATSEGELSDKRELFAQWFHNEMYHERARDAMWAAWQGCAATIAQLAQRTDDFAKIVRAASGQQVLFFKEAGSDDGNLLHCVASFDGFQADMKVAGMPDAAFDTVLARVDMDLADKVLAQVAELGLTEVSHG